MRVERIYPFTLTELGGKQCMFIQQSSSLVGLRTVNMFQSTFLLPSCCYKSKPKSNKSTCHPFLYIFYIKTGFAVHHLHLCHLKSVMNSKQKKRWGGKQETVTVLVPVTSFLFCYSQQKSTHPQRHHGSLSKPKQTQFVSSWV